jgi:predicted DNA-binding transcriptional regulator AlpA
MTDAPETPRRMLNEKQVLAIVPVGHTTLWRLEKAGRFPRSTYISPNRRVWFADEVAAWQNEVDGQGRPETLNIQENVFFHARTGNPRTRWIERFKGQLTARPFSVGLFICPQSLQKSLSSRSFLHSVDGEN